MQFNFGKNWKQFSQKALTLENVKQAEECFDKLFQDISISDKDFIDIGFGQGLSIQIALTKGAKVVGCDINPLCAEVLSENKQFFPENINKSIPIIVGSILDDKIISELLKKTTRGNNGYDIVHSWGVLHHTGDMSKALINSMRLVAPEGFFVVALYNKHWSSGIWKMIKYFYNFLPNVGKTLLIWFFYPIIFVAKFMVTFKNPLKKERGMNFYYDVVDWVGGYPYEYASFDEVVSFMKSHGFSLQKGFVANVPTGCNEFIFQKLVT